MEFAFYICGLIAILATCGSSPHQSGACAAVPDYFAAGDCRVFFSLGAYFAGALEIIVYAGAIMVLFVFVVMMLNPGGTEIEQERKWLQPGIWIGPAILSAVLLVVIVYAIRALTTGIDGAAINAKEVGIALFGPYVRRWSWPPCCCWRARGCLPHWPRRARRRGAEQPSERQRQTKTEEHA